MNRKIETDVSAAFSARCLEARAQLVRSMAARGLFEKDGWRIVETMRSIIDGSEIVMRPLHMSLPAPPDLECVVRILEDSQIQTQGEP